MSDYLKEYDDLLTDTGPAAIVLKQALQSVEGDGSVIFPPTYAAPKGDPDQKPRYNLDGVEGDKVKACAIDSIPSQANRVEPLFKSEKYRHLVPQIVVTHSGGPTNLLDAGHRIADAIVRFSELLPEIHNAFIAHRDGNPEPMAKLAPTSLVFGAWDSRGTQHKIKRLINLRIDAHNVEKRSRSAQYNPATDYVGLGLIDEVDENTGSDLGFAAVPASGQLGGVVVRGGIMRTATINLATLRALGNGAEPSNLQRYIVGLALVALTAHEADSLSLRQGCQLVGIPGQPASIRKVMASGETTAFQITAAEALAFATAAAEKFGKGKDRTVAFDSPLANRIRALWTVEKTKNKMKELAKLRPLTNTELDEVEKAAKEKETKKAGKKGKGESSSAEETTP